MSLTDSYAAYMLLSASMRNHEALLTAYPSPENLSMAKRRLMPDLQKLK